MSGFPEEANPQLLLSESYCHQFVPDFGRLTVHQLDIG